MTGAERVVASPASGVARAGKQEQVRERLLEFIAPLHAGEPLPAERDLAARLGVARMTLRRAMQGLEADHRVIRRPGAGTFVAPARVEQRLAATSFSTDMRARGMVPGSQTIWAREVLAGVLMSSVLQVRPDSPVLHVRRLRTADGEPMALEDLHVPAALVPGLAGEDLENASFYELLSGRYDLHIDAGTQTIEPHIVTDEEAEVLRTDAGLAALLFERTSRLADGRVVEFVRSVYRGDRYRIVADIFPQSQSRR